MSMQSSALAQFSVLPLTANQKNIETADKKRIKKKSAWSHQDGSLNNEISLG